jgi:hypothetical protein
VPERVPAQDDGPLATAERNLEMVRRLVLGQRRDAEFLSLPHGFHAALE